jgi:hypothetical protein
MWLITSADNGQPARIPHTPVGDDAALDEGEWVRQWSNSKKRNYYYNTITGESAWNPGTGVGEGAMQESVDGEEERVLKELDEPQRLRDSGLVFAVMSPSMVRVHTQLIDQGLGATHMPTICTLTLLASDFMHTYFTCFRLYAHLLYLLPTLPRLRCVHTHATQLSNRGLGAYICICIVCVFMHICVEHCPSCTHVRAYIRRGRM